MDKDTLLKQRAAGRFLLQYNSRGDFRDEIKSKFMQGDPKIRQMVLGHTGTLAGYSPDYGRYYRDTFGAPAQKSKVDLKYLFKKNPPFDQLDNFLDLCYKSVGNRERLFNLVNADLDKIDLSQPSLIQNMLKRFKEKRGSESSGNKKENPIPENQELYDVKEAVEGEEEEEIKTSPKIFGQAKEEPKEVIPEDFHSGLDQDEEDEDGWAKAKFDYSPTPTTPQPPSPISPNTNSTSQTTNPITPTNLPISHNAYPISQTSSPIIKEVSPRATSFLKNLSSSLQINARKFIFAHRTLVSSLFSGLIGSVSTYGLTGSLPLAGAGFLGGASLVPLGQKGLLTKGGALLKGLGELSKAAALTNPAGWVLLAGSAGGGKAIKYIVIGIIGGVIFLPVFINLILKPTSQLVFTDEAYSIAPGMPGTPPFPTDPTELMSCKFTRAGTSTPYKSQTLLSWLSSEGSSQGVPPSILASIARHESPEFTTNADDSHDAIKKNNYCNPGQAFCTQGGQNLHMGECSEGELQGGAETGMAMGLMQVVNVFNRDIDLCVITDNIKRGTEIFKRYFGSGSYSNPLDVKKAICQYFGAGATESCPYGGGDYAQEVWQDYQGCLAQSPTIQPTPGSIQKDFALSCPITNEKNTCSSFYDPNDPCHCNPQLGFVAMGACAAYPSLKYGIDIGTQANNQVTIPYINYKDSSQPTALTCNLTYIEGETCPATGCEPQKVVHYTCPTKDKELYLQFNHIKSKQSYPSKLQSGGVVGEVAYYQTALRRLNFQLGLGGSCSGSAGSPPCVPANEYVQCPLGKEGPD